MDGMKPSDLLSRLTADRLEELAASCKDEQIAEVLRALAGAERWLKVQDRGFSYDPKGQMGSKGFFSADHVDCEFSKGYPTLIAALAAVAKQEEP